MCVFPLSLSLSLLLSLSLYFFLSLFLSRSLSLPLYLAFSLSLSLFVCDMCVCVTVCMRTRVYRVCVRMGRLVAFELYASEFEGTVRWDARTRSSETQDEFSNVRTRAFSGLISTGVGGGEWRGGWRGEVDGGVGRGGAGWCEGEHILASCISLVNRHGEHTIMEGRGTGSFPN